MRLLLFMTRGMSLQAWQQNGSLQRELALYAALAERGIRTEIISWGGPEDQDIAAAFPWLRVHPNQYRLTPARYERLMPLLHAWPLIGADVVKCNQTNGGDVALRCALFWRKPFVARCGYVWSEFVAKERPDLLEQTLNLEKEVFSKCHKAIVTSDEAIQHLSGVHGIDAGKFACIPNYVPDFFYTAPVPGYHRQTSAVITQVGRLVPQKNLFALLEACAGLDVTVRLIGDGEERNALEDKARQLGVTVEFKGNVPHETLPRLLAESTICVLVSHFEGHPKALIEYMACGCPVLATNAPGIATVIQDDLSGILCETNAAAIRAGLEKLLENPALRERLGRRAREEAKQYALDAVVKKEWEIHTSFPRVSLPQKWATALRMAAGYGTRKCRSRLVSLTSRSQVKSCPQTPCENDPIQLFKNSLADKSPEEARQVCESLENELFPRLPEEQAIAAIGARIDRQIAGKSPADALRLLFALDANLYQKQGQLAVAYDGGIHTKHRHTKYHDFFVNRLRKGETVLDVGCGNGFLAFDMADKAQAIVTGIDISVANIQVARDRFTHPGATYMCGDALADLPDGVYETIVLSNVLEHLPNRPEFLRSLQERLKPKRYLIRVPLFEREWRVPLKQELGVEWRLDPTHETEYTLESFAEEMEAANLRFIHQEVRWSEIWCEACPR